MPFSDDEFEELYDDNIEEEFDPSDSEFDILCEENQPPRFNSSELSSTTCSTLTPISSKPAPWINVKFATPPTPLQLPQQSPQPKNKFNRITKRNSDILIKTALTISPSVKSVPVLQLLKNKFASPNLKNENSMLPLNLSAEDKNIIINKIIEQEKEITKASIPQNEDQQEEEDDTIDIQDIIPNGIKPTSKTLNIEMLKEQQTRDAELEKVKREKRIKKNTQRSLNKEKEAAELAEKINKKLKGVEIYNKPAIMKENTNKYERKDGQPRQENYLVENQSPSQTVPPRSDRGRGGMAFDMKQTRVRAELNNLPPDGREIDLKKCSKFCDFWIKNGTCTRSSCNFAHSTEQYNPTLCRFDSKCKYLNTCQFKHSFENVESMMKRLIVKRTTSELECPKSRSVIQSPLHLPLGNSNSQSVDKENIGKGTQTSPYQGSTSYKLIRMLTPLRPKCNEGVKGYAGESGEMTVSNSKLPREAIRPPHSPPLAPTRTLRVSENYKPRVCNSSKENAVNLLLEAIEQGCKSITINITN